MNREAKESLYHCGYCGAIFAAGPGVDDARECPKCGQSPFTGLEPAEEEVPVKVQRQMPTAPKARVATSKQGNHARYIIPVVVLLTLVAGGLGVYSYITKGVEAAELNERREASRLESEAAFKEKTLLATAIPLCENAFSEFLNAEGSDWKAYIWNSDENGEDLQGAYEDFASGMSPGTEVKNTGARVFEIAEEQMLECMWETTEGQSLETVFRKGEDEQWLLDGKHFFRYPSTGWDEFIGGAGAAAAMFRLSVRLAPPDKYEEMDTTRLKVQLVAGSIVSGEEFPENHINLRLDRRSDEGLILEAMLEEGPDAGAPYGLGQLGDFDSDVLRIRARIGRSGIEGFTKFRIEEILAAHWVDKDVLGLDLDQLKDDLFRGGF